MWMMDGPPSRKEKNLQILYFAKEKFDRIKKVLYYL